MRFEIKAFRETEGVVDLFIDAENQDKAAELVTAQGYSIISSSPKRNWSLSHYRFPLVLFSQELLCLLEAGIPLFEAIETLSAKETHTQPKQIHSDLLQKLSEGQSLSLALGKTPNVFPPLYIALVQSSEKTGDLKQALSRYLTYQNQVDSTRKKIISVSIYPALLVLVGASVIVFLMTYVVPKFSKVYEDAGKDLPFLSNLLMQWGHIFGSHSAEILAVFIAFLLFFTYSIRNSGLKSWARENLIRIPAIGERIKLYQLAHLYRTIGMLLRGGIPLMTALEMASGLLDAGLRTSLQAAGKSIWEGKPVSDSMQLNGLTTDVALRMLRAGEHSGNLGDMMERIAYFYDEEMNRWIDWFTRLLEPSIMIFIGFVIGTIVLLMYMPIFDLAGSIQ